MERLDRFMARANAAYYATRDPYADFTTSPEISQVFGEILGLWAAVTWAAMGRPAPVLLAEAGPGRGTLMADALRAIGRAAPDFHRAAELHLVETSPRLRAAQAARVPGASWHARVEDLPPGPLLLLANEFLDALPVRQFARRGAGWVERFVDGGRLVEGVPTLAQPSRVGNEPALLPLPQGEGRGEGVRDDGVQDEGTVIELCEPALALARHLGARLAANGGAALFLDYGPSEPTTGESLQAVRDGRPADPFAAPGTADLTAHVDFPRFAGAARAAGAAVHGPAAQGLFLARLGLFQRTDRLARGQTPARAAALLGAARRLAEPDRMGRLFKALAVCHPSLPVPAGFES